MKIDLTPLIQAIIVVIASILTYRVVPYIKSKTTDNQIKIINSVAEIAVHAAEQIFDYGDNKSKVDYAIKYVVNTMESKGFHVDIQTVSAAVESAVNKMKPPYVTAELQDGIIVPPIEDWDLETLQRFVEDNEIPHEGCATKEDYIQAIVNGSSIQAAVNEN